MTIHSTAKRSPQAMMKWFGISMTLPLPDGSRKSVFVAAAACCLLGLQGCSSEGSGDWSAIWTVATNTWSGSDSSIGLQQAGAIPYSTLGVPVGGSPEQMLILPTDNGTNRLWTASSRVAIETRRGRVVRTVGLEGDLSGSLIRSEPPPWRT